LKKSLDKKPARRKYTRQLCQICNREYNNINAHNRRVHQRSRRHQCDLCPLAFFTPREIRLHMPVHQKYREKNILCNYCNKAFLTKTTLKSHVDSQHLKQNLIYCEICGQSFQVNHSCFLRIADFLTYLNRFQSNYMYRTHVRHRHTNERPYQCDKCSYSGLNYGAIRGHMTNVHMVRGFKCVYCLEVLPSEEAYTEHLAQFHKSMKRQYKCTYSDCAKMFWKVWQVQEHINKFHLNARRYGCNTCSRYFRDRKTLDGHIISAHLKMVFSCQAFNCNVQYKTIKSLKNHIKKFHQNLGDRAVKQMLEDLKNIEIPN
jgi:KRAB domain-containing zinc finger protein